jgi:hypothetical protein
MAAHLRPSPSQHILHYVTHNLTSALKSSAYACPLSLTEGPSITPMVSIDPFLSGAHDKSILEIVLFGMWRMRLCEQLLQTWNEPPYSFHGKQIVILIEALFKKKRSFSGFRKNCEKRKLVSSCPCLSVRPHRTPGTPLNGFSWNLVFEDISKNCWHNSSLITMARLVVTYSSETWTLTAKYENNLRVFDRQILTKMMKGRPTKCIFKINYILRISILLLHVSALQERHLQGTQSILVKLYVCYFVSAAWDPKVW